MRSFATGFTSALAQALLVLAASCKRGQAPPDGPLTAEQACSTLVALRDASADKDEKERCLSGYAATAPALKPCADACVRAAKTYGDYKECQEDCQGITYKPFLGCARVTFERALFEPCVKQHEAIQKDHPDLYRCWARCVRHAKEGSEAAACDVKCALPPQGG